MLVRLLPVPAVSDLSVHIPKILQISEWMLPAIAPATGLSIICKHRCAQRPLHPMHHPFIQPRDATCVFARRNEKTLCKFERSSSRDRPISNTARCYLATNLAHRLLARLALPWCFLHGSLIFGIAWSLTTEDVSTAFTVSSYILALGGFLGLVLCAEHATRCAKR